MIMCWNEELYAQFYNKMPTFRLNSYLKGKLSKKLTGEQQPLANNEKSFISSF